MMKTRTKETRLVLPLDWDAGPLDAGTSYIKAVDTRTGAIYFVEPFKSQFSGHRLWKAYCLPAGAKVSEQSIKATGDTLARRFKSLTQAKDACNRHATVLDWPQVQVAVGLTYQQYRLVTLAIEEAKKLQTQTVSQDTLDHTLLAAIEKQLPPLFKQWKQDDLSPGATHREEDAVHVLLSEPGFYALFRCLSVQNKMSLAAKNQDDLAKLRKLVFGKIAAHEQRIVDAKPATRS